MSVTYAEVREAVEALITQGLHPSRRRVRAILGDTGSYETIGKYIDQALRELGLPEANGGDEREEEFFSTVEKNFPMPEPDPARVQAHLEDLRGETAFLALNDHLRLFCASFKAMVPLIQPGQNWLYRRSRDLGYGRELADLGLWTLLQQQARQAVQQAEAALARLHQQATGQEGG